MIRLRVSDLDQWLRYAYPEREEFEVSQEDFLRYLRRESEQTEQMLAGVAFHTLLETAKLGDEIDCLYGVEQDGFRFRFNGDLDLPLPAEREPEVMQSVYSTRVGPVLLRGRIDAAPMPRFLDDYKLTFGTFDAERYADSYQWRAYLDMKPGVRFRYLVFEASLRGKDVSIAGVHELVFWSYPEMHRDVCDLVGELAEFVAQHVPSLNGPAPVEELAA